MINQNYIIPILFIIILIIILLKRKQITKYIDTLKKKYKYLDSLLSSNITYYHVLITIILTLIFIKWDLLKSFLYTNNSNPTLPTKKSSSRMSYSAFTAEKPPNTDSSVNNLLGYSQSNPVIYNTGKKKEDFTDIDEDDNDDIFLGGKLI